MRTPAHRRIEPLFILLTTCAMVICASSVALAGPSPQDDACTLRAEAVSALHAGDRAKAVTYLAAAARLAPDAGLWRLVGDMNASLDRVDPARQAWAEGLVFDPSDPDLLDRIARSSAHVGDWSAAVDAQTRLVSTLAKAASIQPEAERVDMFAGRTLALTDNHRLHLGRLSTLAVLAGDFTTAEEAARALIAADREDASGHLALGYVFLQAQDFADAAEAYGEALAIDPHNPVALNNLGTIDYMRRDLKAAGGQFEAVLGSPARTPYAESIALANLGELHQLEARHADAEYLYTQAIEAFPEGAWSYMGRAALLDLTGRYDEALDAMIDGWERDRSGVTRLNMHFFQPEWTWQRDAMIAEIEGRWLQAAELWRRVAKGDVAVLRDSAAHHLHSIDLMLAH